MVFLVAQTVKDLPAIWETWVLSLVWEDYLNREWQLTPIFLPAELHGQRSLAGYSLWDHKESDTTDFHTYILSMRKLPEDFKPRNGIKHTLLKDHND